MEEDEEEEVHEKENDDEEELEDETRGGDERTVDGRAPVVPERWRDGCGSAEDASLVRLQDFAGDPLARSNKREEIMRAEERGGATSVRKKRKCWEAERTRMSPRGG
jgi:hypothetical protein